MPLVCGFPQTGFAGFQNGISHQISLVRISKCRRSTFAIQPIDEIGGLMYKTFCITDTKAWHPPIAHIGVVAVCDMD